MGGAHNDADPRRALSSGGRNPAEDAPRHELLPLEEEDAPDAGARLRERKAVAAYLRRGARRRGAAPEAPVAPELDRREEARVGEAAARYLGPRGLSFRRAGIFERSGECPS